MHSEKRKKILKVISEKNIKQVDALLNKNSKNPLKITANHFNGTSNHQNTNKLFNNNTVNAIHHAEYLQTVKVLTENFHAIILLKDGYIRIPILNICNNLDLIH